MEPMYVKKIGNEYKLYMAVSVEDGMFLVVDPDTNDYLYMRTGQCEFVRFVKNNPLVER